jgi:hypothetical protein
VPLSLTPEERSTRAKIAAHSKWAKEPDRTAATAPARTAWLTHFEQQVDPEGVLPPEERAIRASHAHRAQMLKLALASSRARARKASAQ